MHRPQSEVKAQQGGDQPIHRATFVGHKDRSQARTPAGINLNIIPRLTKNRPVFRKD